MRPRKVRAAQKNVNRLVSIWSRSSIVKLAAAIAFHNGAGADRWYDATTILLAQRSRLGSGFTSANRSKVAPSIIGRPCRSLLANVPAGHGSPDLRVSTRTRPTNAALRSYSARRFCISACFESASGPKETAPAQGAVLGLLGAYLCRTQHAQWSTIALVCSPWVQPSGLPRSDRRRLRFRSRPTGRLAGFPSLSAGRRCPVVLRGYYSLNLNTPRADISALGDFEGPDWNTQRR
jgi:hypothetical protein